MSGAPTSARPEVGRERSGTVGSVAALPMFPLGSVLVPGMVLPLHVFEPRYQQLTADCLAGDGELGVVLIERGSEVGGADVRTSVGTVARIVQAAQLPEGRWALATVGTRRIRVTSWLDDDPYPLAEVEDWPDPEPADGTGEALVAVVARLRAVLARCAELGDRAADATVELSEDLTLASYQAVAVAPLGPSDRQRLLAEPTVGDRLARLGDLLAEELEVLDLRLTVEGAPPEGLDDDR